MGSKRPPRLDGCDYLGIRAYFLTICTADRHRPFIAEQTVEQASRQLVRTAEDYRFAIVAYCFMPDHLHTLVEGVDGGSDFRKFVSMYKQRSGFTHRQREGSWLWQEGYHDRVLRSTDSYAAVVAYMLNNPVRAGLCQSPIHYPYLGSDRYSFDELAEFVATRP